MEVFYETDGSPFSELECVLTRVISSPGQILMGFTSCYVTEKSLDNLYNSTWKSVQNSLSLGNMLTCRMPIDGSAMGLSNQLMVYSVWGGVVSKLFYLFYSLVWKWTGKKNFAFLEFFF